LATIEACGVWIGTTRRQELKATSAAATTGAKSGVLEGTETMLEPRGSDLNKASIMKTEHVLGDHWMLIATCDPV